MVIRENQQPLILQLCLIKKRKKLQLTCLETRVLLFSGKFFSHLLCDSLLCRRAKSRYSPGLDRLQRRLIKEKEADVSFGFKHALIRSEQPSQTHNRHIARPFRADSADSQRALCIHS